jgi:P27 family predicted phage terminase small subunit
MGNHNSGGHNRKPDSLKKLIGTARADRINENTPEVPDLINISMPHDLELSTNGRKIWNSLSGDLAAAGILKQTDVQAFAIYCNSYSLYLDMEKIINENGALYLDKTNNPKKRPEVTIRNEAIKIVQSYQGKFGLTPADRDRIKVDKPEEADTGINSLIS